MGVNFFRQIHRRREGEHAHARQKAEQPDYINRLIEWQDKMYVPGYYVGKFRPPFTRLWCPPAWPFFLIGIMISIHEIIRCAFIRYFSMEDVNIIKVLIAVFMFIVGLLNLKRPKRRSHSEEG